MLPTSEWFDEEDIEFIFLRFLHYILLFLNSQVMLVVGPTGQWMSLQEQQWWHDWYNIEIFGWVAHKISQKGQLLVFNPLKCNMAPEIYINENGMLSYEIVSLSNEALRLKGGSKSLWWPQYTYPSNYFTIYANDDVLKYVHPSPTYVLSSTISWHQSTGWP